MIHPAPVSSPTLDPGSFSVVSGMKEMDFNRQPMIVIWEVTQACALACRHCRACAQKTRHPDELSGAAASDFLDQVAEAGPRIFILTGGDPMQRPDLLDLVAGATDRGLRVAISPSATPRWLRADMKALAQAGVKRISMSLDGAVPETHDEFRGVPGTWWRSLEGMARARDAGIDIQINTTITRGNLPELADIAAEVERAGAVMWSVFQLVPTGRARPKDLLSAGEMEEVFKRLADLSGSVPFGIKTTEGHHYRRVLVQQGKLPPSAIGRTGIGDGRGFVFVSHTGEVFPSGFLPVPAGNVRRSRLARIYRDSPLLRSLRDPGLLEGKCGQCEYRKLCGGSRARAWAMTGNPLAQEPLCSFQPHLAS